MLEHRYYVTQKTSLIASLFLMLCILAAIPITALREHSLPDPDGTEIVLVAAAVSAAFLYCVMVFSALVILRENSLVVRVGRYWKEILYADIKSVEVMKGRRIYKSQSDETLAVAVSDYMANAEECYRLIDEAIAKAKRG